MIKKQNSILTNVNINNNIELMDINKKKQIQNYNKYNSKLDFYLEYLKEGSPKTINLIFQTLKNKKELNYIHIGKNSIDPVLLTNKEFNGIDHNNIKPDMYEDNIFSETESFDKLIKK